MIPHNIGRDHILKALKDIDEKGVPNERKSRKYLLLYHGRTYPPKYTIAVANIFANGRFLESNEFGGGQMETNRFLKMLGFDIIDK